MPRFLEVRLLDGPEEDLRVVRFLDLAPSQEQKTAGGSRGVLRMPQPHPRKVRFEYLTKLSSCFATLKNQTHSATTFPHAQER